MKNYEENLDDGIPKEREVSQDPFQIPCLGAVSDQLQLELQNIINSQARELELVGSAWYHLQSRWQNNNMTVSRYRHGASTGDSKGWLAKQRSAVAGQ